MDPQLVSSIRVLMIAGGTALANHGYGNAKDLAALSDPSVIEAAGGLIIAGGAGVWSILSRTRHGILKAASKVLGDKGVIVTDATTAARLPGNVVGSVTEASRLPGVAG